MHQRERNPLTSTNFERRNLNNQKSGDENLVRPVGREAQGLEAKLISRSQGEALDNPLTSRARRRGGDV